MCYEIVFYALFACGHYSVQVYINLHFLPILLIKPGLRLSVFWFFMFLLFSFFFFTFSCSMFWIQCHLKRLDKIPWFCSYFIQTVCKPYSWWVFLGSAEEWRGQKGPPLKSVTHILQWWNLEIHKIFESRDTTPEFC